MPRLPAPWPLLVLLWALAPARLPAAVRSDADLPAQARAALLDVMAHDRSSAMLHAADALVTFGQGADVQAVFRRNLSELQATPRRLGAWRQLAVSAPTAEERAVWTEKIVRVLLAPDGSSRTSAFENLCKLHYPYAGATLAVARQAAADSREVETIFAWWALAQAGDPAAVPHLASALSSPTPKVRVLAAYSLRWLQPTDPAARRALAAATDREPAGTDAYPYLLSAALIVDPAAAQAPVWRTKMEQVLLHGHGIERYQACHALLSFYQAVDLPRLAPLLNDQDPDGRVAGAWIILQVTGQPGLAATSGKTPTNIVLILIDDMGWRDVACYGNKYYETPNIDRLAREGMRFTEGYANASNCSPSRACLITGMYGPRHGIYTNGTSERGAKELRAIIPIKNTGDLNPHLGTIANALKGAGYASASIGKWNIGDGPTGPIAHGFDLNIGGNRKPFTLSQFSPYHNKDIVDGPPNEYLTDRLTDEAVKFIRTNARRPFFLYLPHYAVHFPWEAKHDLIQHYLPKRPDGASDNPIYAAMIASVDESVGRIMDTLKELGLADDTLVIFTSDNGGEDEVSDCRPLRGAKGWPYEGGIRVPLIARWPGRIQAGSECSVAVAATDFLPTFLEVSGGEPLQQPMDGKSLIPLLTGAGGFPEDRPLFWHMPVYLEATETGYLQKLRPFDWRCTPCSIIQKSGWKLIEFFEDLHVELYNLKADPNEAHDLAAENPAKARALLAELQAWQTEVKAPIPSAHNPSYNALKRRHSEFGDHNK